MKRKQSLPWMRSRLRRLYVIDRISNPTERQCKRIVELQRAIVKAEKAMIFSELDKLRIEQLKLAGRLP